MIALIQKVSEASVTIDQQRVAEIGFGALALIGVEKLDTHKEVELLRDKILRFRMFNDSDGKMNLNISEAEGSLLLVPQFTLVADTDKGRRPGFSRSATPSVASELFSGLCDSFVLAIKRPVARGKFGADMKVGLVNDGPVTFWLQVGDN